MENLDDNTIISSEENLPKGLPFYVPEDYFLTLSKHIQYRIAIKDFEAKSNAFNTPDNYFSELPRHIEDKINQKEFQDKDIYTSGEFFENQKNDILSFIALNEIIKPEMPFEVPNHYFDNLAAAIESQTLLNPIYSGEKIEEAEAQNLSNKDQIKKWRILKFIPSRWAYAAAAAIILSFGIFYFRNNTPVETYTIANFNTDSLSTSDIISRLEKSDIPEEVLLQNIDEKQLTNISKYQLQIEDKDLKNIINDLDENEITKDL